MRILWYGSTPTLLKVLVNNTIPRDGTSSLMTITCMPLVCTAFVVRPCNDPRKAKAEISRPRPLPPTGMQRAITSRFIALPSTARPTLLWLSFPLLGTHARNDYSRLCSFHLADSFSVNCFALVTRKRQHCTSRGVTTVRMDYRTQMRGLVEKEGPLAILLQLPLPRRRRFRRARTKKRGSDARTR